MERKTCFFIGSRYTPESVREQLVEVVEHHIVEYNVTSFIVGNYGNFDRLVQGVLRELKGRYTNIELSLLAPYIFIKNTETPRGFDGTFYPDGLEFVPKRLAIIQANHYMVKNSDYLIARPGSGNSRNIVEYAQQREKKGLIKVTVLKDQ